MPCMVPRTMCRSVPQIALEVIRTIASVPTSIFGSGNIFQTDIARSVKNDSFHMGSPSSAWCNDVAAARESTVAVGY